MTESAVEPWSPSDPDSAGPRRRSSSSKKKPASKSPCDGCPRLGNKTAGNTVDPGLPPEGVELIVVAPEPNRADVARGAVNSQTLARALEDAGLGGGDLPRVVWTTPSIRCRGSAPSESAEKRCAKLLDAALESVPASVPIIALGPGALFALSKDKKEPRFSAARGTWTVLKSGRDVFAVHDPRVIGVLEDVAARDRMTVNFYADVDRMADRLLGRKRGPDVAVSIYESPADAQGALRRLAAREELWVFDIETYDAAEYPSRKEVSVDPFHPDFRVRGVAIALSPTEGFWVELKDFPADQARRVLDPAFGSPAEKGAFGGHFDVSGLTYTGYVTEVTNRTEDGMLSAVALSDGTHESLRLEKLVVGYLGRSQYWNADKSKMRDYPIDLVANGAVGDACATLALIELLREDLLAEEYAMNQGGGYEPIKRGTAGVITPRPNNGRYI